MGDAAHHGEVVGDEEVGQPPLLLELDEEVEHARLDRDVERRGGLVGDDHGRLGAERAGDGDALALAAGELVWQAIERGGVEPHALQERGRAGAGLAAAHARVDHDGLHQRARDGEARVERGEGILEHHLDHRAQRAQPPAPRARDVLPAHDDRAAVGPLEPDADTPQRGLA